MGLTGFLQGFTSASDRLRQEEGRNADAQRERNNRILQTLIGSDDQDISKMAMTALLTGAGEGKQAKGLNGFFGEIRQHPLFNTLTQLIGSTKNVSEDLGPAGAGMPGQQIDIRPGAPGAGRPGIPGGPVNTPPTTGGIATGAPPPAAEHQLGTPITSLSHPAPREIFMDPAKREMLNAAAGVEGRVTGGAHAFQTLTGTKPSHEFIESTARGAMGAPQKVQADIPVTLTYHDGTTGAGFFDQTNNVYKDASGNIRTDVKSFTRQTGAVNPNANAFTVKTPDPNSPTGYSAVRKRPDGTEIDRTPVAPPPPPGAFSTVVAAPSGVYGVPRTGTTGAVVPLQIPKGVDPATYASHLEQQLRQIQQTAKAMVPAVGSLNDPEETSRQLDIAAKSQGFTSWAQAQATYAAAVKAVGEGVPAAGAPPPAAKYPGTAPKAKGKGTVSSTPQGPPGDPFNVLTKPNAGGRGGG